MCNIINRQKSKRIKRDNGCMAFLYTVPACPVDAKRKRVYGLCEKCARERLREERGREAQADLARKEWNFNSSEQIQDRRRLDKRSQWRCQSCIQEGRRPDEKNRAANEGLCCARGLQEYPERRVKGSRRSPATASKPLPPSPRLQAPRAAHMQRERGPVPDLQHVTSKQAMRTAATRAAEGYGWQREPGRGSRHLEPGLARDFVNTSGTDPRSIGPGPRVPLPGYQKPGIDFDRWDSAQQTNHGRLPPMPGPPIMPLKIPGTRDASQVSRKPVPCRKPSVRSSQESVSTVSPLSSPITSTSSFSPRSSARAARENDLHSPPLRNVMSEMLMGVNEAIGNWEEESRPQARHWRETKW
ncbi:hypothetical protein PZA11_003670 [Diplocarpon coronariae]|nr:hypothetical protein JHW43_008069 [Diplocarpon mali]